MKDIVKQKDTKEIIKKQKENTEIVQSAIKEKGILFEAELMKELYDFKDANGDNIIDIKSIAKTFADAMSKSVRTDINGDVYDDHETRIKAAKELVKIMTGNTGSNGKIVINNNTNTQNNFWDKTIGPDEKLTF